jgi:hypothetical protein
MGHGRFRFRKMRPRVFNPELQLIRESHREIERILQKLANSSIANQCGQCASVCCREKYCRESLDSDFLNFIRTDNADGYLPDSGWYSPATGCRLKLGRPLVCYEYFCSALTGENAEELKNLSRRFKRIYDRVLGGRHMLVVDDITDISPQKIARLQRGLGELLQQAKTAQQRHDGGISASPPIPAKVVAVTWHGR